MSGHTPRKWILHEDGSPFVYALNEKGTNWFSFSVQGGTNAASLKERRAIARKAAAAPDLLKELKRVMSWIDNWSPTFTEDDEWKADELAARAAIAKATAEPGE